MMKSLIGEICISMIFISIYENHGGEIISNREIRELVQGKSSPETEPKQWGWICMPNIDMKWIEIYAAYIRTICFTKTMWAEEMGQCLMGLKWDQPLKSCLVCAGQEGGSVNLQRQNFNN